MIWGTIGGLREIVARMSAELDGAPQLIVTGGSMRSLVSRIATELRYFPHLVLTGIALAARNSL